MGKQYETMVSEAAIELESAIRRSVWGNVTLYIIPTTSTENGRICVSEEGDGVEIPANARVIRPNHNHASTHTSWVTVPYDYISHLLLNALRCEPILQIHPDSSDMEKAA